MLQGELLHPKDSYDGSFAFTRVGVWAMLQKKKS
jgi:hypothetical protein